MPGVDGSPTNPSESGWGHESPDVTLAYLTSKDAELEEAQEHANSSSLALYA
jgi:hypothetical protein